MKIWSYTVGLDGSYQSLTDGYNLLWNQHAGEWLNSLIFHDEVKCITADGQTIIYVGAEYTYMSHDYW